MSTRKRKYLSVSGKRQKTYENLKKARNDAKDTIGISTASCPILLDHTDSEEHDFADSNDDILISKMQNDLFHASTALFILTSKQQAYCLTLLNGT